MNTTFINNVLFFSGKMKRSMSEGESDGEEQRFWENMSLTRCESRRGDWEEGEVKKVKVNLVGVMK